MQEEKNVKFAPGMDLSTIVAELRGHEREFTRLMSRYSSAMLEVETKFKVLNIEFNARYDRNPIENIRTRLKRPMSIYEKLQRIGAPITVESIERELSDVAGVRVICSFADDIYRLADMLAVQDDIYVVQTKDYIKNPKQSGYRSLHMIVETPIFLSNEKRFVRVEVQLRTIAMDFWASLEHKLRYKKDIPPEVMEQLAQQLSHSAEVVGQMDKEMLEIRRKIEATGFKPGIE